MMKFFRNRFFFYHTVGLGWGVNVELCKSQIKYKNIIILIIELVNSWNLFC